MVDILYFVNPFGSWWGRLFWLIMIMTPGGQRLVNQASLYITGSFTDNSLEEVNPENEVKFRLADGEIVEKTGQSRIPGEYRYRADNSKEHKLAVHYVRENGETGEVYGWEDDYRVDNATMLGKEQQVHYFQDNDTPAKQANRHLRAKNMILSSEIVRLMAGPEMFYERTSKMHGKARRELGPQFFPNPQKGGSGTPIVEGGEIG